MTFMAILEQWIEVLNNLIKLNNDRVAGFEKAVEDLDSEGSGLHAIFNKLADESQLYVTELTAIVEPFGEAADGTSTSGDLHRAWIDIKATFTGTDLESILSECERGEDVIKAAYDDALQPDKEWSPELAAILQRQQQGIIAAHDLIRSWRDQVADLEDDTEGNTSEDTVNSVEPVYQGREQEFTEQPSFEGAAGEFDRETVYTPEPESIEQEEAWQEQLEPSTGNSKLMEFFVSELKDLLWAEQELTEALPDMADAATSTELKAAFYNHFKETEVHVNRLEQIFGILGVEIETTTCEAMSGILDEGEEIISDTDEGTAQRDVCLIFAGQKVEHYEIASYGGLISLAKTLGYYEVAELLVLTIDEEKSADALLTQIAENHVNYDAAGEQTGG